uniref:Uncharacterized protein n=1 Tax=viral metagenome TaxID=1070528 RepID=A0A6M3LYG3_9ZZZZ
MGLNKSGQRTYVTIGFGKIRQKCKPDHPETVERKLQSGDPTYAIEYNSIDGILDNIYFKDDPKYGRSWNLLITSGNENFSVQVKEQTRYANDLLKCIPNLHKGKFYTFTPYDFEQNGKKKKGLSIKDEADERVENYYQKFTQLEGGKWQIENLHGYPSYEGDSKDKDELQIYFTRVLKFLRNEALQILQQKESETISENEPTTEDIPLPNEDHQDDLPF